LSLIIGENQLNIDMR